MNKSQSIGELSKALSLAQKKIKSALKDAENPFFRSSYATLASIWDACRDPLSDNGLSISQPISTVDGALRVTTILMHSSGEYIESECPIVTAKNDMQSMGSAISYARRYSLAAIVGVTVDDDDGNEAVQPQKQSAPKPTPKPVEHPKAEPAYLIPFPPYKGRMLSDIPMDELVTFAHTTVYANIRDQFIQKKITRINPVSKRFLTEVETFTGKKVGLEDLITRENGAVK